MLSLRHIWIISKYFCQDEKMQMLLYKISFIFTEKVKRIVTLNAIFKYSATDAHALAKKCADLLLAWKENYLKTRAHIEQSGVGSRWEFNKNILFEDVDHCARISNDIANISLVFIEFENIFKQKLQSLVYNPGDVDNMMNKVSVCLYVCISLVEREMFYGFAAGHSERMKGNRNRGGSRVRLKQREKSCHTQDERQIWLMEMMLTKTVWKTIQMTALLPSWSHTSHHLQTNLHRLTVLHIYIFISSRSINWLIMSSTLTTTFFGQEIWKIGKHHWSYLTNAWKKLNTMPSNWLIHAFQHYVPLRWASN